MINFTHLKSNKINTQFFRFSSLLMRAGLLIGMILLSHTATFSQGIAVKKDGRFSVTIETSGTGTLKEVDETKLLKGFDLAVQWWTLLGEPIEYYDFRWFASDHYWLDGRRIFRSDLEKYPDLLKRFDNLRPTEISILLSGSYGESSNGLREAPTDLAPFYSSGNYKFLRHTEFKYLVRNTKLMITKSGKIGHGIVPGSPRDWEHFIQYKAFIHPSSPTLWALVNNNDYLNNTSGLSESELDFRRKQLEKVFQVAKQVELYAEIAHIAWPEYELHAIAEKYDKYEMGEAEPSPQEETAEELSKVAEMDDFWNGEGTRKEEILVERSIAEVSGHQYIGEKTVTTKSISIKCRDHGSVDGDRVRILLNNEVLRSSLTLKGYSTNIDVTLHEGINRLSFEALNTGSVGSNTAEFTINDANGTGIYFNEWNISTGYKGTLLIIKN